MEKQLESKTIFDGKVIHVTHEKVLCDNGQEAMRECVYHRGGVCILAIEDDCIILVKQFRYPNRVDTIEIPAGKLEENEDPKYAALREFEEETNRRANDMKLLFEILPTPGYCSEVLHIYEAIDFKEVDDALEGDADENLSLIKMPVDEAYQNVLNGKIVDAKTVIAIMYAYQKRH